MDLKDRLKQIREYRGYTQAEMAKVLNNIHLSEKDQVIYTQTVSYWENGRDPSLSALVKMSKAFNLSVDYILGLSDESTQTELTYSQEEKLTSLDSIKSYLHDFDDIVKTRLISAVNIYQSLLIKYDENDNPLKWDKEMVSKVYYLTEITSLIEAFYSVANAIGDNLHDKEVLAEIMPFFVGQRQALNNELSNAEEYFLCKNKDILEIIHSKDEKLTRIEENIKQRLIYDRIDSPNKSKDKK